MNSLGQTDRGKRELLMPGAAPEEKIEETI